MTSQQYFAGTGRRKTAVARVRLYPGAQEVVINGRTLEDALPRILLQEMALRPLTTLGQLGKFGVQAKVEGGGVTGWAGAISHGIARALVAFDETLKPQLRRHGLMTRDSRMKERKKYGLKRARKAPQYTKR
ncbi:MAG TPA: 30S ribosomal protein S9 [Candidatus Limnocylindria bacterium]|nr:30S ribosomal protein S9 [Candidatus Limnocylindria bacterium]